MQSKIWYRTTLLMVTFVGVSGLWLNSVSGRDVPADQPTHKQTRVIKPMHNGAPITLNTFCLDRDGNILACVGGTSVEAVTDQDGNPSTRAVSAPKLVQTYSPDGELLREVRLEFTPTAINQAPDGSLFVAGVGKVAHIAADGTVLATADTPNIGDRDEFEKRIAVAARQQIEEITGTYKTQVELIEKRIRKLIDKGEENLTEREKSRLQTYRQQAELYQDQLEQVEQIYSTAFSPETMLEQKLGVTALAVTSQDVFVCCHAMEGYSYEVWRMDHDLSSPERVVSELGGCCGQCDIQATDDHLVLAENTKFRVSLLDRDGAVQTSFGDRDRKGITGFGSCCNPMNVRCCDNGDIITAESSIGTIKRFNREGELVGVIGKASIGGGCKHVAVAFDPALDRYYMMNVDKAHICVLVPLAEAPEFTEEEKLAKEARDGLGTKLIGEWSVDGQRPIVNATAASAAASPFETLISALAGTAGDDAAAAEVVVESDSQFASYFDFQADGTLRMHGGYMADGDNAWEAVKQDGSTLLISQLQDGIAYYSYRIEFTSDEEAVFTMMYGDQEMNRMTMKRVHSDVDSPEDQGATRPAAPTKAVSTAGDVE